MHDALDYAAEIHETQVRKGTSIAYLSHLMVIEHGGDEDQAIAGLLHDVLEDCGAKHENPIGKAFGERVIDIVLACTDGTPDADGQKAPWQERKEAYIAHLESASEDVLLVSACDKLHNARAIATDLASGVDVFARFAGGPDGTRWYYKALARTFAERLGPDRPLALELSAIVERISR